jgi:LuxR family maltose regulon positive regulatory protein
LTAPDDFLSLAAAYHALGTAYRNLGKLDDALAAYAQGRRHFAQMGHVFMAQLPLYRMTQIQIMQGRLHQAQQTYETARQQAQTAGREPLMMSGEIFGHLSELYWEWNELEQAYAYARQEIELAQSGNMLLALVDGYLKLALVSDAQGDEAGGQNALVLAAETAAPLQSPSVLAQVAMQQARHELVWGYLAAANAWAGQYARQRADKTSSLTPLLAQTADLLLARTWLAQGRAIDALRLLDEVIGQFEAAGRIRLVAEANVLQALAWSLQGDVGAAQKALAHALELASQEGYIRLFVENGLALTPLLNQVRHLFPNFVAQLLLALPASMVAETSPCLLRDPLTEREQEILNFIAQGQTNRQIAEALFISVGTVKGHVNHIFSKLDVNSRTQAMVKARELNLLSA